MKHHFHTTRTVEFSETDMAGIVHFSEFFNYMEACEHAFFRSLGISIAMNVDGFMVSWPRISCSFDYKLPIRFEDFIDIYIDVNKIGNKSISYTTTIEHKDQLVAIGKMTIVCCSCDKKNGLKSIPIPQLLREKFSSFT